MLSRSELVSIWQKALRRIMSKRNKPDFLFILDLARKLLVCRGIGKRFAGSLVKFSLILPKMVSFGEIFIMR